MSKSNMSSRGSIVGFTGVLGGDDKSDENDEDDESLVDFDDGGVAGSMALPLRQKGMLTSPSGYYATGGEEAASSSVS